MFVFCSTQFMKGLKGGVLEEIPYVTEFLSDLEDEVYPFLNFNHQYSSRQKKKSLKLFTDLVRSKKKLVRLGCKINLKKKDAKKSMDIKHRMPIAKP